MNDVYMKAFGKMKTAERGEATVFAGNTSIRVIL